MAKGSSASNTIRKTLLNFTIDGNSQKQIESLVKEFEKLERVTKSSSKQLQGYLAQIPDTPAGREKLASNAKNEVNTQRKILQENEKNAKAILDQLALTIGKGLNPQQQQQLLKGLNTAMGEITGRFTKQAQEQAKKMAASLDTYYKKQFDSNPTIKRRRQIDPNAVRDYNQRDLANALASQRIFRKGASEALKDAQRLGDTEAIARFKKKLQSLDAGLTAAEKQLKKFETTASEAAKQSTKVRKEAERKTLADYRREALRLDPTVPKTDPLRKDALRSLTRDQIQVEIDKNKVLKRAADSALKQGLTAGDTSLIRDSSKALKELKHSTKEAKEQLSQLTIESRKAADAEKKAQQKAASLDTYYKKQFDSNPAIKRRRQIDPNAVRDYNQRDLANALASQRIFRKGASDALKDAQRLGDTDAIPKFKKNLLRLDAGIAAAEKQLKKFEDTTREAAKQSNKARNEAERKTLADYRREALRLDPTVPKTDPLRGGSLRSLTRDQIQVELDKNKVLKGAADKALKQGLDTGNTALVRDSSKALKELKKSTNEAKEQLKALTRQSREAEQLEREKIKGAKAKAPVTEQQRVNRRIEQIQQARTNQRLDGGAQLFRNQGQLLRNYAVMGAGIGGITTSAIFSTELDRQFKQLQSIVNLTNVEMEELSTNLIDVSEKTKFTATEVADAAITLGQAGLGQKDIQNAIEGVTLFATAVGSDLKSAVDLATSTLGVFNKDSSQMLNIVDKMTTAVNNSKLNLDKLTLGLQYSGNLAAQSNVTFEETVSALGAMANSGIRAGSTLGTGLRQIIISLQKPSDTFIRTVQALGISMSDLDITAHGLIPVMRTLAERGFTVRDAMESMEVRAASAYGAFANNIEVAEELSEQMRIGGSSARANETQMGALSNQLARLSSISKSIVYESLEPLLDVITGLTETTADFLSVVRDLGPALSVLAVPASIFGSLLASRSVLSLGAGLLGGVEMLTGGGKKGKSKGNIFSRLINVAKGRGVGRAVGLAARAIPGVGTATLLGTGAVYGYQYLDGRQRANDRVDNTQARLNQGQAETKAYQDQLKKVGGTIDTLILKQHNLADNDALQREIRRLNDEFRQQGLYIDSSVDSYDKLIAKMLEFETSTRNGVNYLQKNNRRFYLENSEAKRSEIFSTGWFDSDAERLLTGQTNPLANGQNSQRNAATSRRRGQNAGVSNFYNKIIASVLPTFFEDLQEINDEIKNVDLTKEGALSQVKKARSKTRELEGELTRILNQSPEQLDALMGQFKLEGKARENAEKYIEDLAAAMLSRANVLLDIETNQKEWDSLDPEKIEGDRELSEFILTRRRDGLNGIADISQDIEGLFKEDENHETSDYLDTFKKVRDIVRDRLTQLVEHEAETISELTERGVANPRLVLQEQGYFQAQGNARGRLEKYLQSAALSARPDANLTYPARLAELDKEIEVLKERLRQVTDRDTSDEIKNKLKTLNTERETVANEQDTLFAAIDGNSPVSVAQRDRELKARIKFANEQFDALQEKTLIRESFEQSLLAKENIDPRQFRLLGDDDELSRLLSDVVNEQRTSISNQLKEVRLSAEELRRLSEDKLRESNEYVAIAENDGYTDETRERASGIANELKTQATELERSAIELEEQGVLTAKEALADFAEYLKRTIIDNPDLTGGRSSIKATKAVESIESETLSLDSNLIDLSQASKDADLSLRDFRMKMEDVTRAISMSPYETDKYNKVGAAIYGRSYRPLNGTGVDENYAGANEGSLGSSLSNAGQYVVDDVNKHYRSYDMLKQMTLEATEAAKGLGQAFGDTFTDLVTGAQSGENAIRSLGASILTQMANIASQAVANQLISSIFSMIGLGGGAANVGGMASTGAVGNLAGLRFTGGPILAGSYKVGGLITAGMDTRDSTYAKVSRGEFILRKPSVDALGIENVRALNSVDKSTIKQKEASTLKAKETISQISSTESGEVNVYVMSEKAQPQLGPNDVKVIIGDDIARDGEIATLIASIPRGKNK